MTKNLLKYLLSERRKKLIREDIFRGLYELPAWGTFLAVLIAGAGVLHFAQSCLWGYHAWRGTESPVGIWRFRTIILGDPVLAVAVMLGSLVVKDSELTPWVSTYEASWAITGFGLVVTYLYIEWIAHLKVEDIAAMPGGIKPFGYLHGVWFLGMAAVLTDLAVKGGWILAVDFAVQDLFLMLSAVGCFLFWVLMGVLDDKPPRWFGLFPQNDVGRIGS